MPDNISDGFFELSTPEGETSERHMMRFQLKGGPAFFVLQALLCLLLIGSSAQGARVAGEQGVTPSAVPNAEPKAEVKVQPKPREKKAMPAAEAVNPPLRSKAPISAPVNTGREEKPRDDQNDSKRFVTIDFDDVDISIFIKFISELTGKNFVIDKGVAGKVTVISPTKISVEEAYKVFESVLEVYDFAAVPAGNIVKVVPAAAAKSKNIETRLKKEAISPDDKVITQLIPLKFANPSDLKNLLTPFVSKNSLIVPYEPTGTLIVTDVLSNIKRLIKIIDQIDLEGVGLQVSVIPLKYATASILEKSLSTVFQARTTAVKGRAAQAGRLSEGDIRVSSDERTNSLIILASENDTRKVRELINLLDREIPRSEGDIHVYYLQNANAEDLVTVLKAIPTETKEGDKKGVAPVISKDVQIVADKATNSLVINAKKSDYVVLEDVIRKLDITRRMVYIEALIMEVSVTKSFDVGVQWGFGKDIGTFNGSDVGAAGGTNLGLSGLTNDDGTAISFPSGLSMGVLGDTITIGDVIFPSISAVINAYKSDNDVHILSTPQIMTTDNEEAEIVVAENRAFVIRQEASTEGTFNYSNYEYKDVGVTLNITPQINQERFVRLKISQEVSEIVGDATSDRPTTLKRQAKTTVIVKDSQTIVIGGLIDEKLDKNVSSVPCLGSIPGVGWLFKSTGDSTEKTNLYIFITPHIVENGEEAEALYEQKRDDIESTREGNVKMYKKPWATEQKQSVVTEEE